MKYNIGTISVTNGSANVTGAGTKWATNLSAGQLLSVIGSGIIYTIQTVTDDTHIVLAANYAGTTGSGLTYTVVKSFTPNQSIPYTDIGDVQTATIFKYAMTVIDTLITSILGMVAPATSTTASLVSKTNAINTTNKQAGRRVFNTTTSKPVWATGSVNTSTWVDATGATAHTPS